MRISSIRSWCRGRSSTIVVTSATRRPNAAAIASMFSATGRLRSILPRASGPTAIFRMYMSGSIWNEPPVARCDHRHRAASSTGDDARAFERIQREIDRLAPRTDLPSNSKRLGVSGRSDHDLALDGKLLERLLHPGAGRGLCPLLVGATEPARARERRALRHPRVALAQARPSGCLARLRNGFNCARHQTFWRRSAADSTSSMTAEVAPSRSWFEITGTPSFSARSTM